MKGKTLVLIPTNSDKTYCIAKFLKNLKKIDLSNADVLFSDDTVENEDFAELIRSQGFEVIRKSKTIEAIRLGMKLSIVNCLANQRIALRDEFLSRMKKENYQFAMWFDSDIIMPKDTIPQLTSWKEDIVSGIYYQAIRRKDARGKEVIDTSPVAYKYQDRESYELGLDNLGSTIKLTELFPSRLIGKEKNDIKITAVGCGCLLLSRKVMADSRWQWRWVDGKKTTEDMWFSIDVKKLGYEIFVDSHVLCNHLSRPWKSKVRSLK